MFKILIYEDAHGNSPVSDYLSELNARAKTSKDDRVRLKKISEYINLLKVYGTRAGLPASKHIEGDIWELRPTDVRFFFAYWKNNTYIILHYYIKKAEKAPKREIDHAKNILTDFLKRS